MNGVSQNPLSRSTWSTAPITTTAEITLSRRDEAKGEGKSFNSIFRPLLNGHSVLPQPRPFFKLKTENLSEIDLTLSPPDLF